MSAYDPMDLPLLGPALGAAVNLPSEAVRVVTDGLGVTSEAKRRKKARTKAATVTGLQGKTGEYNRAGAAAAREAKAAYEAANQARFYTDELHGDVAIEIGIVTDRAGNMLGIGVREPKTAHNAAKSLQALKRASKHASRAREAVAKVQSLRKPVARAEGSAKPKPKPARASGGAPKKGPATPAEVRAFGLPSRTPDASWKVPHLKNWLSGRHVPVAGMPKAALLAAARELAGARGTTPKPKRQTKPKSEAKPKAKRQAKPKSEAKPKPKTERKPKKKGGGSSRFSGGTKKGAPYLKKTKAGERWWQEYVKPDGTVYGRFTKAPSGN